MSGQWTKGPWFVRAAHAVHFLEPTGDPDHDIQSLGALVYSYPKGSETGAANARLIAAAPDLAAALERFVTFHSGHVLSPELVSAMTAARAALSRAKGETP